MKKLIIKKILLPIVLFDFLFLVISYLLIQLANKLIKIQYSRVSALNFETILQRTQQEAQELAAKMGNTLFIIISLVIIFLVLIVINWSFFQNLVYLKILNKRFNMKSFLKFLFLNFLWILSFAIILAVIQKGVKSGLQITLAGTITLLFIYFTNILYLLFTKNNKLSAIKQTFKMGVFGFYRQAIPYLLLILILMGLRELNSLFQYLIIDISIQPAILTHIPFIILALLAIDLTRIYIARALNL